MVYRSPFTINASALASKEQSLTLLFLTLPLSRSLSLSLSHALPDAPIDLCWLAISTILRALTKSDGQSLWSGRSADKGTVRHSRHRCRPSATSRRAATLIDCSRTVADRWVKKLAYDRRSRTLVALRCAAPVCCLASCLFTVRPSWKINVDRADKEVADAAAAGDSERPQEACRRRRRSRGRRETRRRLEVVAKSSGAPRLFGKIGSTTRWTTFTLGFVRASAASTTRQRRAVDDRQRVASIPITNALCQPLPERSVAESLPICAPPRPAGTNKHRCIRPVSDAFPSGRSILPARHPSNHHRLLSSAGRI
uniref:Uncharacterized protein n=1 Tax=Plectus sambesii TaxID=2011161 RepID=A0A914XJG2_9BILA